MMAVGTSTVVLTATARNAVAAKIALVTGLATQVTVASSAAANHTAAVAWGGQAAVAALAPIVALFCLTPAMRRAVLTPLAPRSWPEGFWSYALNDGGSALVAMIAFGRTEIFGLQVFHKFGAVALFALATSLAAQVTSPTDALMGPLTPASSGLVATNPDGARSALTRSLRVCALISAGAAAVAVPFAAVALQPVFGHDFRNAIGAFLALGLVSCIQSVSRPLIAFGLATRGARALFRINLICLSVDILVALALIPSLGLTGAVAANAAAQLTSVALLGLKVGPRIGLTAGAVLSATKSFVIGPTAGLLALALAELLDSRALQLVVAPIAGLTFFLTAFAALPSARLPSEDAAFIVRAFPARLRSLADFAMRHARLAQRNQRRHGSAR
jgi:O-antigen/teichoic acid export membrane protein